MIKPLTADEARALFAECRKASLGCISGGGPYVVPIYYVFDEECIYVHSRQGRKIDALRENAAACVQVERVRDEYHWSSAIAFGSYEEITDVAERRRRLQQLLVSFPHLTPVEALYPDDHSGPASIVFRIRISEITGVGEG